MAASGTDDGSDCGKEIGAPVGAEAPGDFAIGSNWAEFPLGAVVVGRDFGVDEECEEVATDFAIAFSQALAVAIFGGERHDGVEIVVEATAVFASGSFCQAMAAAIDSLGVILITVLILVLLGRI